MNMRETLDRSLEAVAADALWSAISRDELDDAWFVHCNQFDDGTPERRRLRELYMDREVALRAAERAAKMLRV
jgi:hypothetical protein